MLGKNNTKDLQNFSRSQQLPFININFRLKKHAPCNFWWFYDVCVYLANFKCNFKCKI